MTTLEVLSILFIHWVADFLLQTKQMATMKSKDTIWLLIHVAVYSFTWFFIGAFFDPLKSALFFVITFMCHFITHYFTSRWTSKLYRDSKFYGFPSFFSVIGLDQWIHYAQLFLTYEWIKNMQ
jgi:hypothetical protein